jgi:dCTP deaminase
MLLTDAEIQDLLLGAQPPVTGVSDAAEPFTSQSSIQPSSLDLKVGQVLRPEVPRGEEGSLQEPLSEHYLKPGETAVVETQETIQFPNDLAGIVFPPDSMSKKGLLITNPGHVDPGYRGSLKFTVINMGRKGYLLQSGRAIGTLMVFRLERGCKTDWLERHGGERGAGVTPDMLQRLSNDFGDFKRRARDVAHQEVQRAESRGALAAALVAIVAVVLTFIPTYLIAIDRVNEVRERVALLEQELQAASGEPRDVEQSPEGPSPTTPVSLTP